VINEQKMYHYLGVICLTLLSVLQNEKLKETLSEERKGVGHYLVDLTQQKKRISQNLIGLEKEVSCAEPRSSVLHILIYVSPQAVDHCISFMAEAGK
jgi:hypothetical protein